MQAEQNKVFIHYFLPVGELATSEKLGLSTHNGYMGR